MKIIGILIIISLFVSCQQGPDKAKNIYLDPEMQKIYNLQDSRDSEGLKLYLQSEKPAYVMAAVLGLASVQNPASLSDLIPILTGADEPGRSVAAYAIGQLGNPDAEDLLLTAYEKETSPQVKRDILEALGKCGKKKGLTFLSERVLPEQDGFPLLGQARGLFHYSLRNMGSSRETTKIVDLLAKSTHRDVSNITSYYLARLKGQDLTTYLPRLFKIYNETNAVFVRANLAMAMGKAINSESLEFLKNIITSNQDYRVRVNALRGAAKFPYQDIKDTVMLSLKDINIHVALQAANFFQVQGTMGEGETYFQLAQKLSLWQPRAVMLTSAMKCTLPGEGRQKVVAFIKKTYQKSDNPYERGLLLTALNGVPGQWRFVEEKTFAAIKPVLKNYGIQALAAMRRHKEYDVAWDKDFAQIFKKAVQSGDLAMVAMGADILSDPALGYKDIFKGDVKFLQEALARLTLPDDMEIYKGVREAVKYFNPGLDLTQPEVDVVRKPIDWQLVTSISPGQKAVIKTLKGDITLELLVNQSPSSVANFIALARNGTYKNNPFHRVLPNFVAQCGCPRGDGWGSSSTIIRSELGPLYYDEGSVGMASSGKDTESSQWFITHYPTSHLDGGYTIFARVIAGMEVVHKIEMGDLILDVQL